MGVAEMATVGTVAAGIADLALQSRQSASRAGPLFGSCNGIALELAFGMENVILRGSSFAAGQTSFLGRSLPVSIS